MHKSDCPNLDADLIMGRAALVEPKRTHLRIGLTAIFLSRIRKWRFIGREREHSGLKT